MFILVRNVRPIQFLVQIAKKKFINFKQCYLVDSQHFSIIMFWNSNHLYCESDVHTFNSLISLISDTLDIFPENFRYHIRYLIPKQNSETL